jgi:hypothetical protein
MRRSPCKGLNGAIFLGQGIQGTGLLHQNEQLINIFKQWAVIGTAFAPL